MPPTKAVVQRFAVFSNDADSANAAPSSSNVATRTYRRTATCATMYAQPGVFLLRGCLRGLT